MSLTQNQFYGPNAGHVLALYEQYQSDPQSVDEATRRFFSGWSPDSLLPKPAVSVSPAVSSASGSLTENDVLKVVAAARVCRMVRELGHMDARIDPLGSEPPGDPELQLEAHSLTTDDLKRLPASVVGGPLSEGCANALEALGKLRLAYSGAVGYETDHIQVAAERQWLYNAIESGRYFQGFDGAAKRALLERLVEVDGFENYLHTIAQSAKRFSIEGSDILVPVLDELIKSSAMAGTREVVIGMAHRGRLNVLAHVMGKPYEAILTGFVDTIKTEGTTVSDSASSSIAWTGDVKYHLGYNKAYKNGSESEEMKLSLVPNPSHLEFVNPVVEGHVRAAQDTRLGKGEPPQDSRAALALLIHGDAAFPGQGVVAETLNLSRLHGYETGGSIHIIVNNQIGFTTLPEDGRSTLYAADLAKGFEIPIVHVNADNPVACLAIARMAHDYRETFQKDFLIDLIGYRRYGHNEGEEPAYTQPQMYEKIRARPRLRELWASEMEAAGVVTRDEAETLVKSLTEKLQKARQNLSLPQAHQDDMENDSRSLRRTFDTRVSAETLRALNAELLKRKPGFTLNEKLEQTVFKRRADNLDKGGMDYGHTESLAFASILQDGTPIRIAGQDTERGTFQHRLAVLHDPVTGERFVPLQNLPQANASFAIYNSPLSETAALGFEYGYSIHAPQTLVLWEAQFGDFANGAQIIIDQFLVSGNAKWRQTPSLVMLLPHGYEGSGPEHSSARLERFLQLAATDNIRVVNPSNSAQYFHLLRRQAALAEIDPRPLIVMTPKSLLRATFAGAALQDLSEGEFLPVIDDAAALGSPKEVTRLVLCSGKVYYDLVRSAEYKTARGAAVVRLEEIYPFPTDELKSVIAGYPNLQEIVWMQEEPANMGAWLFVAPRLQDRDMVGWRGELTYVGRAEAASPAEGSGARHAAEQARILRTALQNVPELKPPLTRKPVKVS